MEINYFREFVMLAEVKSYWEAAERLYIGQSSLSKHIKTMENQLGSPLFERTSRKVKLTEFGEKMLPFAQSICRLQQQYQAAARQYLQPDTPPLKIGAIPVIPHYEITDLLIQFQKEFPSVQINMEEADTFVLIDWLMEKKCQIAFYRESTTYSEHSPQYDLKLERIEYCRDQLMVVLPNTHPLAGEKEILISQLKNEAFAWIKQDTMPYAMCMQICKDAGFVPDVKFTSHNLEALLDMVVKGNCLSVMFSGQVNFFKNTRYDSQLVFLPLSPPIFTTICMAYRKDIPRSATVENFIRFFQEKSHD